MLWTSKMSNKRAIITFTGLRPSSEKMKEPGFLTELIETGKIKSVIDKSFPMVQAAAAHRYVEAGNKKGSIVINLEHHN